MPPAALRVGLGCMRLDDQSAIAAAAEAGITLFDTAHAYGATSGENERLVARALRSCGAAATACIVTKGGMARVGKAWVPDGRAKTIAADCEASLAALDGLPIDCYLIHAPDPRVPWRTSCRALARLVDAGLVRGVGVSNVSRRQLDEALEVAPIAAVEIALSVLDDSAVRGGLVERCAEREITLIAHSPLGGPRRFGALARRRELAEVAAETGATVEEVALAWVLAVSPNVVAIPGARRPETARSAARAAALDLDGAQLARVGGSRPAATPTSAAAVGDEVVLVMGIPGAGKSRVAAGYAGRGYERLNRDERGGSLRELASALDDALAGGVRRAVLDNTYLTRAARSYVLQAAGRHGLPVRCVWLDIPLAQAQFNLVERLVARFGELPSPEQLRALAREPGVLAPTSQMRALRELEPPSADEGFAAVEHVSFVRAPVEGRPGVLVAAAALGELAESPDPGAPHLVFDWRPGAGPDWLAAGVALLARRVDGPVVGALCPHPGGPPTCWCRPPLPGLPLAFARAQAVDVSRSVLVGTTSAHRTLASTLGSRFVAPSEA